MSLARKNHTDFHGRQIKVGDRVRFAPDLPKTFQDNNFYGCESVVENLVHKQTVIVEKRGYRHIPVHRAEVLEVIED